MKKQESNFREIIKNYLHLSGVKVSVFLKNGKKINLTNAVMKKDHIINNYYEDFNGKTIPLDNIKFAELYTE